MSTIVTLTLNPAIDRHSSVAQVIPEKKLRCAEPELGPGGGGINVARAIQKLGGTARAVWTCGGIMGELMRQLLDDEAVDHQPMSVRGMTRLNLIVREERSGQQFRFNMPGAALSRQEARACLDLVEKLEPPPEFLVLSGSLPPGVPSNFYAQIAHAAPKTTRVVLDTSGDALRSGVEAPVFLIKPNLHELEQLAGRDIAGNEDIRDVSRQLIDEGQAKAIVTSLGRGGAVLVTADDYQHVGTPTVKIRSKVGAGDSTVAGIVLALHRGESITDAMRFGVAAGAAAVMNEGAQLCRREDTERLYASMRSNASAVRRDDLHQTAESG
jgi:6-phosphofructokinase 2